MAHKKALIVIGVIIALLPFMSFPISWDHVFMFFGGATVVVLSFLIGRGIPSENTKDASGFGKNPVDTFVQNEPPHKQTYDRG